MSRAPLRSRRGRSAARVLSLLTALVCPQLGCDRASSEPPTAPDAPSEPACGPVSLPEATPQGARADDTAATEARRAWIEANYDKRELLVPMRDGVRLFTVIYEPRDRSRPHPFLMIRTPYSVGPYGAGAYRDLLGPSEEMLRDGYIFVYQDVRGRFMSEGEFVNMRPHQPKRGANADGHLVDESTDTHDTIAWLLEEIEGHNGKVGQWGISYPGFYAAAGMIDHHPALVAVSPQAPIADWWFDDFHHHGAFFLPHAFNFLVRFGVPRPEPVTSWAPRFEHGTQDGYAWFLGLGPLRNATERYMREIAFWQEIVAHPNRDTFWEARDILPHLRDVAPAVLTVGGWFDAEDLYGPLQIYRSIEAKNPGVDNRLVMGPWAHGGWSRSEGDHLGNVDFGAPHSRRYREEIERRFFAHHLLGEEDPGLAEATMFETGRNAWRSFDQWPPAKLERRSWYLGAEGGLVDAPPRVDTAFDAWVSDPARPVPYTEAVNIGMTREYMTDDQRFAARRPDVLSFRSEPVQAPLTLAGPVEVELWVSTSERDADWVVKLIDVFPDDAPDHAFLAPGKHMGGYQMMVRSEVFRGRFRGGYDTPRPFEPGVPTRVSFPLQDVLHTLEPGHRLMIQVQSTWFPMVDRNPQGWVDNIFEATEAAFRAAEHRVYRDRKHASRVSVGVLAP